MRDSRQGASPWQTARVVGIRRETPRAKSFRLALASASSHLAGQHYVVRLTAPDGYRASRSYSIASAPDDTAEFELTVERLQGGEVSSFLHDEVRIGDELEVRGPIGGWFVWDGSSPSLLVGGGSGIVPLMAMLRLGRLHGRSDLVRLVVSVRAPEDLFYAQEVEGPETTVLYSRSAPPCFARPPARLSAEDLIGALGPEGLPPGLRSYVCGSSGFAESASQLVLGLGVPAEAIRVERFGPSG